MLSGREPESARIDEVLHAARRRLSGALVVRGEAGIGKSALLDAAVERAGDMRVLRAIGVDSEVDIPFSGLHELLRPALSALDELPEAQATAVRGALGLHVEAAADKLAVFGGVLGLLAAVAGKRPLLCVIDDAHWLDDASATALVFAARRFDTDGIAMLFGVREPDVRTLSAPGVPSLRLHGLSRSAAREVVAGRLPLGTAGLVVEQVVESALGNPLALVELSGAHIASQPSAETMHPIAALEQMFARRVRQLPRSTRRALVVVAASDVSESRSVAGALEALQLDVESLAPAEQAGLIVLTPSISFCHPLARSAIYGAAGDPERREAHHGLASAAAAAGEADREAWHLAAAAHAPDERIASALVGAAESARRRGGLWSEARALERAARLTPDAGVRAKRLALAGDASYRAGRPGRAEALLDEALTDGLAVEDRARAEARRAYIHVERGELDAALKLMIGGANELEPLNQRAAATLLTNAATVFYHRLEIAEGTALAERAWRLAGDEGLADAELCHVVSFQRLLDGRVGEGMKLARHCAALVEHDGEGRIVVADAASSLLYGGDVPAARRLLQRAVRLDRASGAIGQLGYTLHMAAQGEWYGGDLQRAYAGQLEAVQIVEELGTAQVLDDCLSRLASFEAALGREEDCRRHARRALESAVRLGDRRNEVRARGAMGLLALGTGDAELALAQLTPSVAALERGGHGNPNHFRLHADLVEAQVRVGQLHEVRPVLASLERHAQVTGIAWTTGAASRCKALVERRDGAAEACFHEALRRHEKCGAFELGRTALCFGEWLRRRGRRRDARIQLAAALEQFEACGAVPWEERARSEARASGLTLQRREAARHRLTPQEQQVALLVAEGKTNRDVAATLFVTPKTVEFHLTGVYRKLEIRSRSELIRRMADEKRG